MIFKIFHSWILPFKAGQFSSHKVTKGQAGNIDIIIAAMQEIHRHIQNIIHPPCIAKIRLKHKSRNTASIGIGICPGLRPRRFQPGRYTIFKRRVRKQGSGNWLKRKRGSEFAHHIAFICVIQIHLNRTGTQHHIQTEITALWHIFAHNFIAPLWHPGNIAAPP